jgi:predicted DNA-binding transcriptional regulator AlpA
MNALSTREAAKKLGLSLATLARYVATKKVPAPKIARIGRLHVYAWTESDIERVRRILPKIGNGRKTRYKKKAKKISKKK